MRRILTTFCLLAAWPLAANQPFALVNSHSAALLASPSTNAGLLSEALFGEPVLILEEREGWTRVSLPLQRQYEEGKGWGQYQGWMQRRRLTVPSGRKLSDYLGRQLVLYSASPMKQIPVFLLEKGKPVLCCTCEEGTILPEYGTSPVPGMRGVLLPDGTRGFVHEYNVRTIEATQPERDFIERFIGHAEKHTGTRYLWGGTSADGLDCSGLVYLAARTAGLLLPRDSGPQSLAADRKSLREARRGDLVFFTSRGKTAPDHVAIFLGENRILHAFQGQVQTGTLADPRLAGRQTQIGRVQALEPGPGTALTNQGITATNRTGNGTADTGIPAAHAGLYSIHVASLLSAENTISLVTELYRIKAPTMVLPVRAGGRLYHAVHLGLFAGRERAERFRRAHARFPGMRRAAVRPFAPGGGLPAAGFHSWQTMSMQDPYLALENMRICLPSGERPWVLVYRDSLDRQWSLLMAGMYPSRQAAATGLFSIRRMMRQGMQIRRLGSR